MPESNHLNSNKDQMTTIFVEKKDDFRLRHHLTYNPATKVFKLSTERTGE